MLSFLRSTTCPSFIKYTETFSAELFFALKNVKPNVWLSSFLLFFLFRNILDFISFDKLSFCAETWDKSVLRPVLNQVLRYTSWFTTNIGHGSARLAHVMYYYVAYIYVTYIGKCKPSVNRILQQSLHYRLCIMNEHTSQCRLLFKIHTTGIHDKLLHYIM